MSFIRIALPETLVMVEKNQEVEVENGPDGTTEGGPVRGRTEVIATARDPGPSQWPSGLADRQSAEPGQDKRRDAGSEGDHEAERQPRPRPERSLSITNLLVTALVGLVCGAIGAMGYSAFFGTKSGTASASQSKTEEGSKGETSSQAQLAGPSGTAPANATTAQGPGSNPGSPAGEEVDELKQQIANLSHRIDQLGERIDRLQQLLSVALPFIQRIAPKS
jgi:hypothetical protein